MNGHHLILGRLTDFVTGETLPDTHDERYRQTLAKLLVNQKGYSKTELTPRLDLQIAAGDKRAIIRIDLTVLLQGRIAMIVRFGPGSVVTRQRPSLAASRLIAPYQIPVVVVTNGTDTDVLDGRSGKIRARHLSGIPTRAELTEYITGRRFEPISARRAEMESRIIYAYEVDDSCPCDDRICRLPVS